MVYCILKCPLRLEYEMYDEVSLIFLQLGDELTGIGDDWLLK